MSPGQASRHVARVHSILVNHKQGSLVKAPELWMFQCPVGSEGGGRTGGEVGS
jgi:hypothetical protein